MCDSCGRPSRGGGQTVPAAAAVTGRGGQGLSTLWLSGHVYAADRPLDVPKLRRTPWREAEEHHRPVPRGRSAPLPPSTIGDRLYRPHHREGPGPCSTEAKPKIEAHAIQHATERLILRYAGRHDPEVVRQTVNQVADLYATAQVHAFVPVLIERDAQTIL